MSRRSRMVSLSSTTSSVGGGPPFSTVIAIGLLRAAQHRPSAPFRLGFFLVRRQRVEPRRLRRRLRLFSSSKLRDQSRALDAEQLRRGAFLSFRQLERFFDQPEFKL